MSGSGTSRRVAFATSEKYRELTYDDLLTLAPLASRGIQVEAAVWTEPGVDWRSYSAVVVRSCWDYYQKIAEFRAWLADRQRDGTRLLNPADVILDNIDKGYLRALERKGARLVPTVWIEPSERGEAKAKISATPWSELVIKPAVSGGAFRTVRIQRDVLLQDLSPLLEILGDSTALVQPFLPEILDDGEWSFLYFGETFSHAVVKKPKAGDFRVQWVHGGSHGLVAPPEALLRQVDDVRRCLPPGRLYSRIDGVVQRGQFLLVEVEMIEPHLFFTEDPESPDRFAAALATLICPS